MLAIFVITQSIPLAVVIPYLTIRGERIKLDR